jgi:tripartite-type tricarboxylate transporter receptor subunit TctC
MEPEMKRQIGAGSSVATGCPPARRRALRVIVASLCLSGISVSPAVQAQADYPSRVITIVVPFSPGTGADILARLLGQKLGQKLGVGVVVDNRVGASGNIGAQAAANAAPDGYTLLVTATTFVTNSAINKNRYDPVKSFTPVSLLATASMGFVVRKDLPVKSIKDLVVAAKARPGTLTYASSGAGTPQHLAMEQFKLSTGIDIVHVPFKASAGAVSDLAGGHIDAMILPVHTAAPLVQAGRMRMLAIVGSERSQAFKNVPTLAEEGFPNLEADVWYGMLAPAGTPGLIVDKLNAELDALLAIPEVKEHLSHQGMTTAGGPPDRFAKLIKSEMERWPRVVAKAGIKGE